MTLLCTPDVGVPLPSEDISYPELRERAAAACKTLEHLAVNGLPPESFDPTPADAATVASIIDSFAEDEPKINKALDTQKFSAISPAAVFQVNEILTEFGRAVVKNAVQVRNLVTNKLLIETENPDARVRIRALELLGKMSDVGLFTERSEVVVTHRSTDDLKLSLREKLEKLRSKVAKEEASDAIVDMEPPAPLQDIDVDAELGL
jgi:hypothetical protein